MAVKTFTTGEVLTAADTNTYLNNGGLVYITQASWATGATVTISNCFTSTYNHYRIIGANVAATSSSTVTIQLTTGGTPAATNYGRQRLYVQTTTVGATGSTGEASSVYGFLAGTSTSHFVTDMFNPNVATSTYFITEEIYRDGNAPYIDKNNGLHTTATAYDGFRITSTNNLTSGTWFVYGYRMS
jgi:hypothetical protein